MKENEYQEAQTLTLIRVACDTLRSATVRVMPVEKRREFFRVLNALEDLRDNLHQSIPIEESES